VDEGVSSEVKYLRPLNLGAQLNGCRLTFGQQRALRKMLDNRASLGQRILQRTKTVDPSTAAGDHQSSRVR
jgi:hypothetical protein